jgi:hypothetical protein
MNFLITPRGELQMNSEMDDKGHKVAGQSMDELKALGALAEATGELVANCPLFCVNKANQPGQKRCIADCKQEGQNHCCGKYPVSLVQCDDILPHLYQNGWSAVADASKHYHNFTTSSVERKFLGCIHPVTVERLVWRGLPMGAANSPATACRIGNGSLHLLLYWSNPVSQVLRAMAVKRTTRGRSNFGELMTAKIS